MRFLAGDDVREVQGRTGPTSELRPVLLELKDPRSRWVLSREPLSPAAVLSEVVWILSGRRDSAFVDFFNNELKKYAGEGPTYHGAYGYRLRYGFGPDQLSAAARALTGAPDSRQVCLSIWDPRIDMPLPDGRPRSEDIPCNVMSLLKVRDACLEWTQIMRSNDFWLGLPFNIVQFTMLQEIMAGWLGLGVGSYHHLSDSLHLYPEHVNKLRAAEPLKDIPTNTDDLASIGRDDSDRVLDEMAKRIDLMTNQSPDQHDWHTLRPPDDWPVAYANIYRVILAEAARRKGLFDLSEAVLSDCDNGVLACAQERWTARLRKASGEAK